MAVGGDDQQVLAGGQLQMLGPCVRPVQQADPVRPTADAHLEARNAIGDQRCADEPCHLIMSCAAVTELAVAADRPVLQDERQIVGARRQVWFVAVHDQEAGEAPIHLLAGVMVRMGVVPVVARWIGDHEVVLVGLPRPDRCRGLPVLVLGHHQPVPVHDAVLVDLVVERDTYPLSLAQVQRRPEIRPGRHHRRRVTVHHVDAEAQHVGGAPPR